MGIPCNTFLSTSATDVKGIFPLGERKLRMLNSALLISFIFDFNGSLVPHVEVGVGALYE
jgi:hypothetical protein